MPQLAGRRRGRRPASAARRDRIRRCRRSCSTATSTTSRRSPQAREVAVALPGARRSWRRANTIHISALGDRDDCAQPMVRRFVRTLERRRHELRDPDRRGPDRGRVPAPGGGRRGCPAAGGRSQPAWAPGGWRRSPRPPSPTRSSAGSSTAAAPTAACAAGAGATRANGSFDSASAARGSRATCRSAAPRRGGSPTARSARGCSCPGAGGCAPAGARNARSRWRSLDGRLGGRKLRATMLAP